MSGLSLRGVELARAGFHLGPIDLDVPPGTATVLLGPSGAGKTTLLRATAGFLAVRRGTIELDGRPLETEPPERRGFGFVPPSLGLFPHRTVERNVRFALEISGAPDAAARARRWIEHFALGSLARRYPSQLSSGERQRVAMARALAAEPKALLWDEPLNALDVESREALLGVLTDVLEEERIPLLLVTHDPTTALALATRLVVLERGRIRFRGRPEELAAGRLDRFTARFLGYENLASREELAGCGDPARAADLLSRAGPGGLLLPPEAISWAPGAGSATVRSIRWTASGWSVTVQWGSLTVRAGSGSPPGRLRAGDRVGLSIDLEKVKPLDASEGVGA